MGETMYPSTRDYKYEKKDECCNVYVTVNCENSEKCEKKPCYDADKWSKDCDGCNVTIIINCGKEDKKYDK